MSTSLNLGKRPGTVRMKRNEMITNLTFLAATILAGASLVFTAGNAQVVSTVLHLVWLGSTKLIYDPLLVAAFILAFSLAVGKSIDVLRGNKRTDEARSAAV